MRSARVRYNLKIKSDWNLDLSVSVYHNRRYFSSNHTPVTGDIYVFGQFVNLAELYEVFHRHGIVDSKWKWVLPNSFVSIFVGQVSELLSLDFLWALYSLEDQAENSQSHFFPIFLDPENSTEYLSLLPQSTVSTSKTPCNSCYSQSLVLTQWVCARPNFFIHPSEPISIASDVCLRSEKFKREFLERIDTYKKQEDLSTTALFRKSTVVTNISNSVPWLAEFSNVTQVSFPFQSQKGSCEGLLCRNGNHYGLRSREKKVLLQ